jgi:RNA polymerase sigma-70 factor (ECF subfamily)
MVGMTRGRGPQDGDLLAEFRAGHEQAFEAIVARHYPGLLRVAEQRCGAGALAEDAVAAALVRAHRYLRRGTVLNLGGWLRRVVLNCATDLLLGEPRNAALDRAAGVAAPEETRVERAELRAIVEGGIGGLPETYRAPLRLHYLFGFEAKEIAAQLGDNLNSVKSRIARGRRELRRRLEGRLRRAGYL